MLNIGLGEMLVIALLGILVFGPDRLPEAAARAAGVVRQLRSMAAAASKELKEAADLDPASAGVLNDVRELSPRRLAASVLEPATRPASAPAEPARREAKAAGGAPGRAEGPDVDPDLA